MENSKQSSRKSRIMQALQQRPDTTASKETKTESNFPVDDIQSFIRKAVHGDHPQVPATSITQRMKQLHGWQAARRVLIARVLQYTQDIELLEKKVAQCSTAPKPFYEKEALCGAPEPSASMPQYLYTMLTLSDGNMVTIGPNGTQIPKDVFIKMNWGFSNANIARKILMEVFDRQILATHTLSGKPSPAFMGCNKPSKMQLDPLKVQDIIYALTNSLDMTEKDVRQAITTKCADENKMFRQREERRLGNAKRRNKSKTESSHIENLENKQ